jgi:hypothetical protein
MNGLLVYNPIYFTGLEDLKDFDTWRAMYRVTNAITAPYIDRTEKIKFPIKTYIPNSCIMPEYDDNFSMSYLECSVEQADIIYTRSQHLGVPVYVFWSGGIDSSMVLTAFITARGMDFAKKHLRVVMTPESIIENPFMYHKFILPNLEIVSGEHIDSLWGKDKIIVTGELNDQLIGSDVMRDFISFKGTKEAFTEWNESEIARYYNQHKKMPIHHAEVWAKVLSDCVRTAPCPVYDYWDFYWYITFACKWMYVNHRLLVYADPSTIAYTDYKDFDSYYVSFFASVNFQKWSMKNSDKKHQGTWQSHKWYPRQLVSEFMKDPGYLNKNKNGSLWKLAISKFRVNAIDQNLNMIEKININDWYNPNNSFKDIYE